MKYSQLIGFIASLLLICICFLPWTVVDSLHISLSGLNGYVNENLNFGKQYIPHTFFAVILAFLFYTNKIWSKRTNSFVAFLNLGWAVKNFILFSLCRTGICPSVQPALYALLALALIIQVMTFLPKMEVES